MRDSYPIVQVHPAWRVEVEEMGSKRKFWYRNPVTGTDWLFKYPRQNTGEHWAEKIAAEVAARLGTLQAKVELAEFLGIRGSVTESFAGGGQELVHGNQLLGGVIQGYDPERRLGQSAHTLSNIWEVMDLVFGKPADARMAKLQIAEYLVLDALIGNTDRHHENWGLMRHRTGDRWNDFVAPSFDHASSLGRELLDEPRDTRLAEKRVGQYADKGHGGIYWSEKERRGPSPLELVRRGNARYPEIFGPAIMKLDRLDEYAFRGLVNCVPDDWMTPSARAFASALLCCNFGRLGGLV